jgi:predicted phosphate transport protein (TIGR00153 family)
MLIFKKEKHVRKLILAHLNEVQECLMESRNVIEDYIAGDLDSALQRVNSVIEIESRADLLERQIREVLLDGAFLPHIRSDVYRLVEAVDAIAGKSESVARFMWDQSPEIPEQFEADLLDIFRQSLNCFLELRKALRAYFKPKGEIEILHIHVARVCEIETEVDARESALIRQIFTSQLELAEQIHLKQLVSTIGNIADLSEDASDELEFAAMKSVV